MEINKLLQSAMILFAIVNPVGNIPIILQLTGGMNRENRQKAMRTAIITSVAILFLFILAGKWILAGFFQISLPDLMAAGGLLLLIIAIDHLIFGALVRSVMVSGKKDAYHIGAVPIACPILAGPGAMMTVLMTFSEYGFLTAAGSIVLVMGIINFVLSKEIYYRERFLSYLMALTTLIISK